MSGTADRLVRLIRRLDRQDDGFDQADLDEMRVLHEYCRDELPQVFNDVLDGANLDLYTSDRKVLLHRLVHIHGVARRIPAAAQKAISGGIDQEELLPSFTLDRAAAARVNALCDEARRLAGASDALGDAGRRHVLSRLAAIRIEILKPVGLFDIIRGALDDLINLLGPAGAAASPLIHPLEEIVTITRNATRAYDALPSPDTTRRLPGPKATEA